MIRAFILAALIFVSGAAAAYAEPAVKVVNFTASWCPNCRILTPRIEEAVAGFPEDEVMLVTIDMSDLRGKGQAVKWETVARLKAQTEAHQVRYLWDWYGGYTGLAIIVAADNGEPISCLQLPMTRKQITERINEGHIIATHGKPGMRMPEGPRCPPPKRPQR